MDELRQVRATNLKSFRLVNAFAATVSKDYVTRLKAHPRGGGSHTRLGHPAAAGRGG